MQKLISEQYKVMTLGMLIDAIEICLPASLGTVCLNTSEVYDIYTEVCDVTVDGNHMGTIVSLEHTIEMFEHADVAHEMWMLHNIPHNDWHLAMTKLREVWKMTADPNAWCVLVTG
jgi:hypothetical protein